MRILLVEDDSYTQQCLKATLTEHNFLVDIATDGETAWELQQQFSYDLLLLDVMLPRLDGITLCQQLRQAKQTVLVMMLTSRHNLTDKLQGLNSGADDYLIKPVDPQELIARIRTLLRRGLANHTSVLSYDRLSLDPVSREVTYDGKKLKIGRKEYLILELLLRNPHQVYSRNDIVDRLWSVDEEVPAETTVKSHIRSIRRKLEQAGADEVIETLYGHGYRLHPKLANPSVPSVLSPPDEEKINHLTAQVWQRAYVKSLNKVAELDQAIASLQAGKLEDTARQQAIFIAHKLAGSLSVFGFDVAAQLAQQIEESFRPEIVPTPKPTQMRQWARSLRQELDGQQILTAQEPTSSTLSPGKGARILAVDDDSHVLRQMATILTAHGMQAHTFTELDRLEQMLEQIQPDLLIVDLLMPKMNGLKLCQKIRQDPKWATLPILVLSSRSDRETIHKVFACGADDYIPKPIVPEELITRINNRLSRYRALQTTA